jgi:hypothetical protein
MKQSESLREGNGLLLPDSLLTCIIFYQPIDTTFELNLVRRDLNVPSIFEFKMEIEALARKLSS